MLLLLSRREGRLGNSK